MLWKGVKVPDFARFSGLFRTALIAVVLAFGVSNAYSATCSAGKSQEPVFDAVRVCGQTGAFGYEHTGNTSTNSPISTGDGTWVSYFPSFRVKGKAYCSTTAPATGAQAGTCNISRRPMATNIDTGNNGTYCWCQATEHQQISDISHTWTAPFQRIQAKYVYLKKMDDDCTNSCAAYCSYMQTNLILDGSIENPVSGNELRATIYDSLLDCVPTENKLTYYDGEEIIDYQYYDGTPVLKSALVKPDFYFKGWCVNKTTCTSPVAAGSTQKGWSGERKLYAQWERTGCGVGVKTEYKNGTLYCLNECADGYEEQFNPMSVEYSSAPNEQTFCYRTGNAPERSGYNWAAWFSSFSYIIRGRAFCSATAPSGPSNTRDSACQSGLLYPMLEEIDTENSGQYCWCQAQEYEQLHDKKLNKGKYPLSAKWVYASSPYNCSETCASLCSSIVGNNAYDGMDTISLRVSIYRSVNKCAKATYTLRYQSGDAVLSTLENYTVSDTINLPTPPTQPGFVFAGWCEDLNDCPSPMSGTATGLFGNKTLYAKWEPVLSQITYVTNGATLPQNAPTVYSVDQSVSLVPAETAQNVVFNQWYDNPDFNGNPITTLPNAQYQSGNITLYANQQVIGSDLIIEPEPDYPISHSSGPQTPVNCGTGYESNTLASGVLNPSITMLSTNMEYRNLNGKTTVKDEAMNRIRDENAYNGIWGIGLSYGKIYGDSSCNATDGTGGIPPANMIYPESGDTVMSNGDVGKNCWCKMTDYTLTGRTQINTPNNKWIFVKTFNNSDNCKNSCTGACIEALYRDDSTMSNKVFLSQLYGDYSACKMVVYDIEYEFNGGTQTNVAEVWPDKYTTAYHDVVIPNSLSREHYTFDSWCEDAALTQNCSANKTVPTGSSGNKKFYAKWTPTEYNIEYNLQNGAIFAAGAVHPNTYNIESSLTISAPDWDGRDFDGWCVGETDYCTDEAQLQNVFTITPGTYGNIILWPHWATAEFNIVYKTMSAEEITGLSPTKYTFGVEETLPDNVVMPNYDFVAWHVRQSTDSPTVDKVAIGTSGDQVFFAEMAPTKYDITYHDGDITFTEEVMNQFALPVRYTYNVETPLPDITKLHYDFVGWYDNAELTGDAISAIPVGATGAKEFWAKWQPTQYTVSYYWNTNEDDGIFTSDTYTVVDPNITPLPDSPERDYFRFDGWADENGDLITEIITVNGGNRKIYGTWTRISCEKDFYLVDGECVACPGKYPFSFDNNADLNACYAICREENKPCPEHSDMCDYDSFVVKNDEISTRINYYQSDKDPCQIVFDCQTNYHVSGEKCEPDVFNITYHDGETVLNADYFDLPKTYTYSVKTQLPDTVIKLHHTFVAWHEKSDLSDYPVTEISETDSGDKDFYAEWTAATYYVRYNHGVAGTRTDGFTGEMPTKSVAFGEDVTLDANAFGIDGYTFKDWSCTVMIDSGESYTENYPNGANIGKYNYAGSMTCTANWVADTYTLNYDCGDGELANVQSASVTVTYDLPYVLNDSVCKPRTNHSITHWECTNNLDMQNNLWNIESGSNCVAHWGDKIYHIEYRESNGALINTITPTTYTAANTITVPDTNPTRDHYMFVGWCDNTKLNLNCSLHRTIPAGTNTDPKVFYAKWAATECPAGQYLDSTVCKPCPGGYTSDAWSATHQDQCYFDWECIDECPDGADCEFVGGAQSGRIYWGQNENYSCDITVVCHRGYTYDDISGKPECMLNNYTLHYYNITDINWGTSMHPRYYNVNDSTITIGTPTRNGYTFDGWCEGGNGCENPSKVFTINPATIDLRNIELYAQWTQNEEPVIPDEPETPTEFVCTSGRVLHVGVNDTMCLSNSPESRPAFGFGNGNNSYYLQMTEKPAGSNGIKMNKDSNKQLNIWYNGKVYNIHDGSVGQNQ